MMSSPENNKVPKKDKPLREVSVEGCELIGKGGNGAVYRLDPETIVKVYFGERNSPEKIKQNREVTKNAFVHGIPTTIAFDMVRVGENYGVVFEMINARSPIPSSSFIIRNSSPALCRIPETGAGQTLKQLPMRVSIHRLKLKDLTKRWTGYLTETRLYTRTSIRET